MLSIGKLKGFVLVTLLLITAWAPKAPCQSNSFASTMTVHDAIEKVKDENSENLRWEYASKLPILTKAEGSTISDGEIEEMAGLLSDQNDSVRQFAAMSLKIVGPRAKLAVPELKRALWLIACAEGDATSELDIQDALLAIGSDAPIYSCVAIAEITAEIRKIRNESSSTLKVEYARDLYRLVVRDETGKPSVPEVYELGAALSDQENTVKYWIARSLEYIGPRAQPAVKSLEEALRRAECDRDGDKSAVAIRSALAKISEKAELHRVGCN